LEELVAPLLDQGRGEAMLSCGLLGRGLSFEDGENEGGASLGGPSLRVVGQLVVGHELYSLKVAEGCLKGGSAFKGSGITAQRSSESFMAGAAGTGA